MALDPTKAIPGTVRVNVGGDARGGGTLPALDAGHPVMIEWDEVYGVSGGATFADKSGIGAGDKACTYGSVTLKNGLADVSIVGGSGVKVIHVAINGCLNAGS